MPCVNQKFSNCGSHSDAGYFDEGAAQVKRLLDRDRKELANEAKPKAVTQRLMSWLQMFSKLHNPKSMSRAHELRATFLGLLSHGDVEVSKPQLLEYYRLMKGLVQRRVREENASFLVKEYGCRIGYASAEVQGARGKSHEQATGRFIVQSSAVWCIYWSLV